MSFLQKRLNRDQLLPIELIQQRNFELKLVKVVKMSGFEYLCGLIVLLFGFNIGYYEAGKGLTNEELKSLYRKVVGKLKK